MFTTFQKSELDSKQLYFKLNNSLQICSDENQSPTLKFAGLYAIFKDGVCYYVGQSQNLASRISQHITGKYSTADTIAIYFAKSNGFDDFYERGKEARKAILECNEMHLIKMFKPIENLITPDSDFHLPIEKQFDWFKYLESDDDCLINGAVLYRDASIFINDYEIAVCEDHYPCLSESPAIDQYNEEVIDNCGRYGVEVCHREMTKNLARNMNPGYKSFKVED